MKQVPDRKKLRRAYLKSRATMYGVLFVPPCLVTGVYAWLLLGVHGNPYLRISVGILGCLGTILYVLLMPPRLNRVYKRRRDRPYVPPVTVADALPTDEILVRGSEEPPVQQSEMLLRAAQQGHETPKEELLRVSQE